MTDAAMVNTTVIVLFNQVLTCSNLHSEWAAVHNDT